MSPRIVLDTNVILSALLFGAGRVSWLVPLWQQKQVVPLLSTDVANELIRVLAYPKFKLTIEPSLAMSLGNVNSPARMRVRRS